MGGELEKDMLGYKQAKNTERIIGGTLSLTLSTIILKLLGVIYKIPLAQILTEEGMGYFNSAYTVYTFFYLLCTAGVPKAVMIVVSEAKAENNDILVKKIMKTALIAFFLIGAASSVSLMVFSSQLSEIIGNSNAKATILSIAPSIIFISLSGVLRGYLSADMKFFSISVSQIVDGVGRLATGLAFAIGATRASLPLPIVSSLTILGVNFGAVFGLLYLYICYKMHNSHKKTEQNSVATTKSPKYIFKKILNISLPITLSSAIMSIGSIIDLVMIMNRLSAIGYSQSEATALYGNYTTLAVPMFNLALSLVSPISTAFMPVFTKKSLSWDTVGLNDSVRGALTLTAFVAAPLTIGLMAYSRESLTLIFGDMGVEIGASLLRTLSPAVFFSSVLLVINSTLEASGSVKAPIISMSIGSAAKIIISYFGIASPDYGISAAPIGTVISYAVALLVSIAIAGKSGRFSMPIISTGFLPYALALSAVALSKAAENGITAYFGEKATAIISIVLCALIYFTLCAILALIWKKRIKKWQNIQILHKNISI